MQREIRAGRMHEDGTPVETEHGQQDGTGNRATGAAEAIRKAEPNPGGVDSRRVPFTPGPWRVGRRDTFGTRVEQAEAHRHPRARELGVDMETRYEIAICKEVTAGAGDANAAEGDADAARIISSI